MEIFSVCGFRETLMDVCGFILILVLFFMSIRDYKGNNQKRWVTESQFEVDRSLYQSLTFENSPKELKLGDVRLEKS